MSDEIRNFIERQDLLHPPEDDPMLGVFEPEFALQFEELEDIDTLEDGWWLEKEEDPTEGMV